MRLIALPLVMITVLSGADLRLQLRDHTTGSALRRVPVHVMTDNGVRCMKAPCPTDARNWNGRTDNGGRLTIPADIVNRVMNVTPNGYETTPVPASCRPGSSRFCRIDVTSKHLPTSPPLASAKFRPLSMVR